MKPTSHLAALPAPHAGRVGWPWTEETPADAYAGRNDWPRISIVTPSFNQASYLEETIRSVLLQNYPNLQLIVIDGGSTDGSREILERYAPWLDHWESEPDRGQSHAINKGLARCTGEWFNWINSDDCLLPGALAAVGAADPAALNFSGPENTGPNLAETNLLGRTKVGPTFEDALVNHFICQQGLFLRTDAVRAQGGVREELHYVMDLDLFARVLLQGGPERIRETDVPLAFFRRHDAAKTSTASDRFFAEERRIMAGLGAVAGVSPQVLAHVVGSPLAFANPGAGRIDPQRLELELARKYWWNGTIESAWRTRNFALFKREAAAFRFAFPDLRGGRFSRLHFLSRLPEPVLRFVSHFRS